MAEGFFNKIASGRNLSWQASSAGTSALDGFSATDETVRVMEEEEIDVSGHRRRRLTGQMVESADKIFVMEHAHRDRIVEAWPMAAGKVFLLGPADVPDPIGREDGYYREVLEIILGYVEKICGSL